MKGSGYLRALQWIEKQIMRYRDAKGGLLAIENGKDEFIGQCGLLVQEINGKEFIEVGYHLLPKYWGNGYAREAANFFRNYAEEYLKTDRIISIIHPDNEPSKKVALNNHMRLWKKEKWSGFQVDIYSTQKT
jgi:RimJ/RimL family protein N-acetyltransferase